MSARIDFDVETCEPKIQVKIQDWFLQYLKRAELVLPALWLSLLIQSDPEKDIVYISKKLVVMKHVLARSRSIFSSLKNYFVVFL